MITKLNDHPLATTQSDSDPWSTFLKSLENDEMNFGWCVDMKAFGMVSLLCLLWIPLTDSVDVSFFAERLLSTRRSRLDISLMFCCQHYSKPDWMSGPNTCSYVRKRYGTVHVGG